MGGLHGATTTWHSPPPQPATPCPAVVAERVMESLRRADFCRAINRAGLAGPRARSVYVSIVTSVESVNCHHHCIMSIVTLVYRADCHLCVSCRLSPQCIVSIVRLVYVSIVTSSVSFRLSARVEHLRVVLSSYQSGARTR
ncbi:hypothetical protein RRG08_013523 [Elysia crispata]|uniref:Uncharacterized protein n=1 Tax=Elysia crispata TaxID=231223 RepID=A0AAE1CQH0_9GAST|nr:hypothetical protein RRG08_013523 [Elysia crispata]